MDVLRGPSRTELVVAIALGFVALIPRLLRAIEIVRNVVKFGSSKASDALIAVRTEGEIVAVPFLPFSGRRCFLVIDQDAQKQALSLPLDVADSHDALFLLEAEFCVFSRRLQTDSAGSEARATGRAVATASLPPSTSCASRGVALIDHRRTRGMREGGTDSIGATYFERLDIELQDLAELVRSRGGKLETTHTEAFQARFMRAAQIALFGPDQPLDALISGFLTYDDRAHVAFAAG